MLTQIRDAAREARQLGFIATAEAMELFADTHVEMTAKLATLRGGREQAFQNEENELEKRRCGASAENCCSIVRRVHKLD